MAAQVLAVAAPHRPAPPGAPIGCPPGSIDVGAADLAAAVAEVTREEVAAWRRAGWPFSARP